LHELRFEPGMPFSTRYKQGHAPVQRMHEDLAAVLRRRTGPPESWVQLHFGFLCHEAAGKVGRQVGRQPGSWVWLHLDRAQHFMGSLDDGQGQPAVVSTWCPTWPEMDYDMEGYYLGPPQMELLATTCWWVDTYALYEKPALYKPVPGNSEVWRLRTARRYADSAPESWRCTESLRPTAQLEPHKPLAGIRD
jgi:hypothetical protein